MTTKLRIEYFDGEVYETTVKGDLNESEITYALADDLDDMKWLPTVDGVFCVEGIKVIRVVKE